MPRVSLPLQSLDPEDSIVLSYTNGDAANGHAFTNTGRVIVLLKNTGAGAVTVTIVSTPDARNRTGDEQRSVVAGTDAVFGPFPRQGWNQTDETVYLNLSADTGLKLAAVVV